MTLVSLYVMLCTVWATGTLLTHWSCWTEHIRILNIKKTSVPASDFAGYYSSRIIWEAVYRMRRCKSWCVIYKAITRQSQDTSSSQKRHIVMSLYDKAGCLAMGVRVGSVEWILWSPPEVSFLNWGIIPNRPCNAVLLTFWQVCKNGEFRHKICMTVSQLVLQHTRAKVNESACDIRLSIIMLNHEHPTAGNGRNGKNGAIKPKSESLLFKTSISALKPFTFPRWSAHLYMNGLLSCRRPLNSSMAVSWVLFWSYEWDRRPWKTHSRLCVPLSSACSSQQKREMAPSTSLWTVSLYLEYVFVPLHWIYLFITKYASEVRLTGRHAKTHIKLAVSGLLTLH